MKHIILIYFILTSIISFGQNDSIGVFIPKDDGTPFCWPIKHMWVGKKNFIASTYNGSDKFIKVWTDNGVVDTVNHCCIKPIRTGSVNVFSIQQIWTGKKYDTIQTKSTFKAIVPPNISLKVIKDNLKKDSTITISLVDSLTLKPVDKRYQVGRIYEPLVYDSDGNFIRDVLPCGGTTIYLENEIIPEPRVKSGYKIKIRLLVRDIKTDLLIPSNELIYTLK